jgi:hypothetical protein
MDPATTAAVPPATLQHEYAALLRYVARLQQRVGGELVRLERENLRLRAALLVQHTAWLWGLAAPSTPAAGPPRRAPACEANAPPTFGQVLCQVACEGHAHRWLAGDGQQCKVSGQACERVHAAHGATCSDLP